MDRTIGEAKRELRSTMRAVRRSVDRQPERSAAIWQAVRATPGVETASVVMVYSGVWGEPDSSAFVEWCRDTGKVVVVPDPAPDAVPPLDPLAIDVAIVPGLAFTACGHRLGQGGGWYDRVLTTLRPDALVVGVCFAPQLLSELPTEPHDIEVDVVVTDEGIAS